MTFEPSPTARRMAEALRAGVSARLRDFEAATPGEDLGHLHALGAIDDLPPVAKPTAWSAIVRTVRRLLRGLMRPWLVAQTTFNRTIADRSVVTALATHGLSSRVTELERSVEFLREQVRRSAVSVTPAGDAPASRLDRETVLRLIVQSRIRRPPARVLVCGSESVAQDLVAFGYDVIIVPRAQDLSASVAPFDVAVWLPGSMRPDEDGTSGWPAVSARALRGGAQAIIMCESRLAPAVGEVLDISERMTAREDDRGWIIVEETAPLDHRPREPIPGEITVIVAERPHAPDR